MSALICGSLAYDTIMVFQDHFRNHILPDKVHILNVSFLVPRMRREFGGCAGNIAYNLKLLGEDPVPFATVGQDFGPYREHLSRCGINLDHVRVYDDLFTPQCFITTDMDNNQITAFHPGAMLNSHEHHVRDVPSVSFGIVAPDSHDGMLQHSREFAERGVPFIFDPGQAMPLFSGDESHGFLPACSVPWSALSPRNQPVPVTACFRGSLLRVANHDACGRETGPLWVSARWVVTTADLAQKQTRVALCHQLETGAWAGTRDFHVECTPSATPPPASEPPAKAGAPGSAADAPAAPHR